MEENLPERISNGESPTFCPVSPGAEKWLYRPIKCLNHGFVYLIDYLGNDSAIAQAARVSYGQGTKKVSEDRGLIRYLLRRAHTTPFEMGELKFHCKMPIFVARQWIRHRTANVNEESLRYSFSEGHFYVPDLENICEQSASNKQGRGKVFSPEEARKVQEEIKKHNELSYAKYAELANAKQDPEDPNKWIPIDQSRPTLSREIARGILPVNLYTQWYWKIDLHNLFHFLRLRLDNHAQYEIRVYAEAMARIVKDAFPLAYQAFEDYQLNSKIFSGPELEILRELRNQLPIDRNIAHEAAMLKFNNKRETEEFLDKLNNLGWLVFSWLKNEQ